MAIDIPDITVTTKPFNSTLIPATGGDGTFWDKSLDKLFQFGGALLDFELQSKALKQQLEFAQKYGVMYNSPGSNWPAPGQFTNPGVAPGTVAGIPVGLLIVGAMVAVGFYAFKKA